MPPPVVRFHTNLGDLDVQLLSNSAPNTVANFLAYMNAGAYNNSIIHRSVPGFIWQGRRLSTGERQSGGSPSERTY